MAQRRGGPMSVVQHIRDRAGHFRWMGLLVVWAVFIAMAAVLLVERAGVQYSAGQHKLGMLAANDAVPASSQYLAKSHVPGHYRFRSSWRRGRKGAVRPDSARHEDRAPRRGPCAGRRGCHSLADLLRSRDFAHAVARWARYAPERHYELGECRRFAYARHASG